VSGGIRTSQNASGQNTPATVAVTATATGTSTSTSSAPTVTTTTITSTSGEVEVECPSADGLNYTAPGTSKVFKRECDVNYFGGEGIYGLQNQTVLSVEACIQLCSLQADCVAINFNYKPQCWLKQYEGIKSSGDAMESAILWQ